MPVWVRVFAFTWPSLNSVVPEGQAGAIRLGLSRAIVDIDTEYRNKGLRKHNMLTRDARRVERKKPGQKKARKKFAWVKR